MAFLRLFCNSYALNIFLFINSLRLKTLLFVVFFYIKRFLIMKAIKKTHFTPTALFSGAAVILAIYQHWITDIFVISLSLVFDRFSVKSSGLLPDIILTVLFALLAMGTYYTAKHHKTAVIVSAACAVLFFSVGV
jgi:hypothetical protein